MVSLYQNLLFQLDNKHQTNHLKYENILSRCQNISENLSVIVLLVFFITTEVFSFMISQIDGALLCIVKYNILVYLDLFLILQ